MRKHSILAAVSAAAGIITLQAAAPEGWYLAGSKPANYDTGVDQQTVMNARPSAFLRAKADQEGFGTLMQDFAADNYVGKRIRYSAYVKAEGVMRRAGLWMRVDGKPGTPPLSFDNMQNRAIKGTTGWQRFEVVLDVPDGATGIYFGILLDGPGAVWLNSANIQVVDESVAVTGTATGPSKRPLEPRNLDFDK